MKPQQFIKNFRDVGKSINLIVEESIFPEKLIYRAGSLNNVFSHEEILNIPTIINLKTGKDNLPINNYQMLHIPTKDKTENYSTHLGNVRKWINNVIQVRSLLL